MLILDIKAQRQIARLILRAAEQPLPRGAVERQIRQRQRGQNVLLDASLCVVIPEDYLVSFCFEDSPGLGLARHLSVSRNKPGALPVRAAVEMLMREFGITGHLPELVCWFQPGGGRGTAIHLVEPLTVLNSAGLPLAPQAQAMVEDEALEPAPDELDEDEAA